jgi:hypothetical protein
MLRSTLAGYPTGRRAGKKIISKPGMKHRSSSNRRYHWALLVGPKNESSKEVPGVRYHVRNPPLAGWTYEKTPVDNIQVTVQLLARILIAKVEDLDRLNAIFESVPVIQGDPKWTCRSWIASALEAIAKDGKAVGTSMLDWTKIEEFGRRYVAEKTAANRYKQGDLSGPRPMWDMLENKERMA